MSCKHDMANGTCSQCDPYVVQNLRASLEFESKKLGIALRALGKIAWADDLTEAVDWSAKALTKIREIKK